MILFRRICITLAAIGAALFVFRNESSLPTLPVPSGGLLVKALATLADDGDYFVCVTMPKQDGSPTPDSEIVPCSMAIILSRAGQNPVRREITSLSRYAEFGFGRVEFYRGGDAFRLTRGDYEIEVTSKATCTTAATRGATLQLERAVGNLTNFHIRGMLRSWLATASLLGGLLGLIASEFWALKPRPRETPPAPSTD